MALGSCCKARGFSVLHLIYKPTAVFLESDLDDRQALYSALASLCWSPDRLNEI